MYYYIGIDDTDNLESRGTGHRARQLGTGLQNAGIARLISITRHQLLVHKDIPYTSHNSSACLLIECEPSGEPRLIAVSYTHLDVYKRQVLCHIS